MKLYLVEHFFSVQGEGRYMGSPSIFLRFGGCNLRCPCFGESWYKGQRILGCDTVRATNHKLFKDCWEEVTDSKYLINIIESYLKDISYKPDIVLTGGEPMIHSENKIFYEMIEWLVEYNFRTTVETNSTIAPVFDEFLAYKSVTFAMAVKLSNSGEPKERRIVPEVINRLAKEGRDSFFKFTLDKEIIGKDAYLQIEEICREYKNEIYCMPLGDNIKDLQLNALSTAEFCLKHGYNYSDRLHVRLWNREEKR
jgi:organic radical activating enzyme